MAIGKISHQGGQNNLNSNWYRYTVVAQPEDISNSNSVIPGAFANFELFAGDVVRLVGAQNEEAKVDIMTDTYATVLYPNASTANENMRSFRKIAYGITHGKEEKFLSFSGKLGKFNQVFDFGEQNVRIKEIIVVPHKNVRNAVQLNILDKDGNGLGNVVVPNDTQAFQCLRFVKSIDLKGKSRIQVNAVVDDEAKTECSVAVSYEALTIPFRLKPGEEFKVCETSDLGHFAKIFSFPEFVRIKYFAIQVTQDTTDDIEFKVVSVAGADIEGDTMSVADATRAGSLTRGCFMPYITKSANFSVTAGAASVTSAKVYVVYERLGDSVEYTLDIPNGNSAHNPYVLPDTFDATISEVDLFATSVAAWNKGAFVVTLLRDANNICAGVDCGDNSNSVVELANNVIVPANGLKVVNVATGGSTEPVTIKLNLCLS